MTEHPFDVDSIEELRKRNAEYLEWLGTSVDAEALAYTAQQRMAKPRPPEWFMLDGGEAAHLLKPQEYDVPEVPLGHFFQTTMVAYAMPRQSLCNVVGDWTSVEDPEIKCPWCERYGATHPARPL